jgi:hypothetical protein
MDKLGSMVLIFGNPAWVGFLAFCIACIVSGLFFAGKDAQPQPAVNMTIASIQKWTGVVDLIAGFLSIVGHPDGKVIGSWFGTLVAYFGFTWILLSDMTAKGGDTKPMSTFIFFTAGVCALYSFIIAASPMWPFTGMLRDVFILLAVATIACIIAGFALRGVGGATTTKLAGYGFILAGLIGCYIIAVYVSSMMGIGI